MSDETPSIAVVTDLMRRLDERGIRYTLSADVPGSIMVCFAVPNERWEVNYYDDGDTGVEVFKSSGVSDLSRLFEFFERGADKLATTDKTNHRDDPGG
jgi:hypothetical protein